MMSKEKQQTNWVDIRNRRNPRVRVTWPQCQYDSKRNAGPKRGNKIYFRRHTCLQLHAAPRVECGFILFLPHTQRQCRSKTQLENIKSPCFFSVNAGCFLDESAQVSDFTPLWFRRLYLYLSAVCVDTPGYTYSNSCHDGTREKTQSRMHTQS